MLYLHTIYLLVTLSLHIFIYIPVDVEQKAKSKKQIAKEGELSCQNIGNQEFRLLKTTETSTLESNQLIYPKQLN